MEVQGALVSRYFPSKTHQCLREDGHLLQGQVCVEPIDPSSDGHEEGMHAVRHLTRTKKHGITKTVYRSNVTGGARRLFFSPDFLGPSGIGPIDQVIIARRDCVGIPRLLNCLKSAMICDQLRKNHRLPVRKRDGKLSELSGLFQQMLSLEGVTCMKLHDST